MKGLRPFIGKRNKFKGRIREVDSQLYRGPDNALEQLHRSLWQELNTIYIQEELTWYQHSRCKWLAFGDKNSKFFHSTTVARIRKNKVKCLKNEEGVWVDNLNDLKHLAVNFFKKLYTEDSPSKPVICVGSMFSTLSSQNWTNIGEPSCLKEVKNTVFNMRPFKAPRYYGLHAIFFQS
ncbi:uncharacterized protein LOC133307011 [Gastrolobium bilobum]|uniref:uncharacterized protein LOC133307011 n=1 Tax=Gastrolobium bilobum TaxID=150636 RepID=UPI002AB177E5|nr:uncharacterized protein LOC133307011 [Gastrolobium bilobum]